MNNRLLFILNLTGIIPHLEKILIAA